MTTKFFVSAAESEPTANYGPATAPRRGRWSPTRKSFSGRAAIAAVRPINSEPLRLRPRPRKHSPRCLSVRSGCSPVESGVCRISSHSRRRSTFRPF